MPRRKDELVAVRIAERRESAPRLLFRLGDEPHTSLRQLAKRGPHVVARKDHIRWRSDAIFLARRGVEHHAGVRSRDAQLDPALLTEWLICHHAEAQLACVEVECGVLIPEIDPYVIDVLLPDLVEHDRHPSAYLTYLYLYRQTADEAAELSLTQIAEGTGLSKRAVQAALARLQRRGLVDIERDSITSVGRYTVNRPWQNSR